MKQLSAFLLLSVLPLGATCTGSSPTWRCPSTGNAVNDGANLRTFLGGSDGSSIAYSLGDTIILDAGAEYDTPLSGGNPQVFTLPKQPGCANGSKKTKIVGTRTGEFAKGYRIVKTDITKMPVLKQVGAAGYNGGVLQFFDSNSAHNGCGGTCTVMTFGCFEIDGIAFVQGKEFAETYNIAVSTPLINIAPPAGSSPTAMDQLPHDMILRHVLITNSQELDYGTLADCQDKKCAFRSTGVGITLSAVRVAIEDSAIYGLGGFDPTGGRAPVTVTCTQGLPATCSGTGLAANLGITAPSGSECANAADGLLSCNNACYGPHHCTYGVLDGAPSGWHDTNSDGSYKLNNVAGVLALTYINSTTVSLDRVTEDVLYQGKHVDTIGNPSWSGTATIILGNPQLGDAGSSPPYNFDTGNISDIHLRNNYMENGSMGFFVSGGGFPTAYGKVLAGSTATTINVGSVTSFAEVGDVFYVPVTSHVSIYCNGTGAPCTGKGCCSGDSMQGRITGISGSPVAGYVFTVIPFGPGGIDQAPATGVDIKWKGLLPSYISFRRNTVRRWYNSPPLGKGLELKSADTALFDGNDLIGASSGIFLEPKNQNGQLPWATGRNLILQNNISRADIDPNGGTTTSGPVRLNVGCGDYEWSTTPCWNVWFQNSLFLDQGSVEGAPDTIEIQMAYQSGFRHNYSKFNPGTAATWNFASNDKAVAGQNIECNNYEAGEAVYSYMFHYLTDNIVSFGYGISENQASPGDQCWKNIHGTAVKRNVFVSDQRPGTSPITTSVINAAWPGNGGGTGAATNWAAVGLVGTCDGTHIANCALDPASSYIGIGAGGSDPGPDVPRVIDHQNGWSEQAGLIYYEPNAVDLINNPAAFVIGSTNAAVSFRLFGDIVSNCTFILYTNVSRQTEHGDTNTGPEKACNRTGSLFQNGTVTFVLGINTALTAGTTYYYLITDGVRIMPGSFTTLAANVVGIITSQLYDTIAADAFYYSSTSTNMSSPTAESPVAFASNRVTIEYSPLSGVRYYKIRKRDGGAVTLWESLIGVTFR